MRKALAAAMAALTFGTAMAATALPAQAETRHHRDYYRSRGHSSGDVAGAAIVAGIAGLALGSALSSGHNSRGYYNDRYYGDRYYGDRHYNGGYYNRGYYDRGYYDRGYYGRSYRPPAYGYYDRAYGYYGDRFCESRRWVYDRYAHRRVLVRSTYRC
jgi:hypothetical protein